MGVLVAEYVDGLVISEDTTVDRLGGPLRELVEDRILMESIVSESVPNLGPD